MAIASWVARSRGFLQTQCLSAELKLPPAVFSAPRSSAAHFRVSLSLVSSAYVACWLSSSELQSRSPPRQSIPSMRSVSRCLKLREWKPKREQPRGSFLQYSLDLPQAMRTHGQAERFAMSWRRLKLCRRPAAVIAFAFMTTTTMMMQKLYLWAALNRWAVSEEPTGPTNRRKASEISTQPASQGYRPSAQEKAAGALHPPSVHTWLAVLAIRRLPVSTAILFRFPQFRLLHVPVQSQSSFLTSRQFSPSFQNYHQSEKYLSDMRREAEIANGKRVHDLYPQVGCSITAIGNRVDGLIRSLERQSFPSEVSRCRVASQDKWEAFRQVGSSESSSSEGGMTNRNLHRFLLSDCSQFLSSDSTGQQSFKSLETKLGIWDEEDSPRNLPILLARIPNASQAQQCLDSYDKSCGWIHRLLHWPAFRAKAAHMLSRKHRLSYCNQPDIHWLAVLFAACGLGLWAGDSIDTETCQDLPRTKLGQRRLALRWLRCATSALVLGQYDQDPSLDSLRTMSLLLCFPLYFSDDPSMEGAMELIMQTISLARQLNLDVDPDDLPYWRLKSETAKDERRRFMVAILCQEFQLGGLFCKKWYFESPSQFALKMPNHLPDDAHRRDESPAENRDAPAELDGVISRYKVGQIWQLIGIGFSEQAGAPAHGRVLELDQQLLDAEEEFPARLKTAFEPRLGLLDPLPTQGTVAEMDRLGTHLVLASAHIRLHRPFVIPRGGVSSAHLEWHRRRILYYGRFILALYESDHLPLLKHVSMNLFVLAACIALSVLLITPTGPEEDLMNLRQQVHQVYSTYQNTSSYSNSMIWNRSYKLLGSILETDRKILLNPEYKINFALLETLLQ
ncbi:hypothetical protein PTTG_28328 [Puccinia triticina 1-1 BBBD Race 1]|uniref:Transcription factor domain-containing protein n=2 Tax=Puccinia triticina TaxID=208348 RepID=A0A180GDN9_PUCT1|nr:uncharacterized protein PtA15_5A770 [Puccinia triticina]OAV90452.1 hypothetical protein PTTG_28328 [Puccinia triticina 1-1 BBBD Race 1]WAQ85196.1 hypothetical protein PtA15_5A770 [Puccinia triticina]WAR58529.1 hypothetical protein PtB15_5B763 [Puccinia triticina]